MPSNTRDLAVADYFSRGVFVWTYCNTAYASYRDLVLLLQKMRLLMAAISYSTCKTWSLSLDGEAGTFIARNHPRSQVICMHHETNVSRGAKEAAIQTLR